MLASLFRYRASRESFGSAGYPVPEQHLALRNGIAASRELPLSERAADGKPFDRKHEAARPRRD